MLRTSTEDLATSIATAGELGVVTVAAVDLVHLATELFVHQGHPAPIAEEAGLVPMLILVRQILERMIFGQVFLPALFPPFDLCSFIFGESAFAFLSFSSEIDASSFLLLSREILLNRKNLLNRN